MMISLQDLWARFLGTRWIVSGRRKRRALRIRGRARYRRGRRSPRPVVQAHGPIDLVISFRGIEEELYATA